MIKNYYDLEDYLDYMITRQSYQSYFKLIEKVFRFRGHSTPYEFDMRKPWWQTLFRVKYALICLVIVEGLFWGFLTYGSILLGRIYTTQDQRLLYVVIGLFSATVVLSNAALYFYCRESARAKYGLNQSAYTYFILSDPLNHTFRSTGKIINKISVACSSYETLSDMIVFDMNMFLMRIVFVAVSFLILDIWLGIIVLVMTTGMCALEIVIKLYISKVLLPQDIKADNDLAAIAVESLQQVFLVRSTFATPIQYDLLKTQVNRTAEVISSVWFGFVSSNIPVRVLFVMSCAWLYSRLLFLVQAGEVEPAYAISVSTLYLFNYGVVARVGRQLQKLLTAYSKLQDLFDLAHEFGDSRIPVLTQPVTLKESEKTFVLLDNVNFSYNQNTVLFRGHCMSLVVPKNNTNKLYGIIGPSGTGKTTLLNLLGGQIYPASGSVIINGIDVYSVGDSTRRMLIGLQMQTASNLRGTLRSNLLFGLPPTLISDSVFSEQDLVQLIKNVGLWDTVFAHKDGLDTLIGEGGVNLSGGQRQRLNFAGLYLRSKYFTPEIILIDEPTSSLDEISEHAITSMIRELSHDSVVFVVAHRLNTLSEATALLDTSLITQSRDLVFMDHESLLQNSQYYRDLLDKKAVLED